MTKASVLFVDDEEHVLRSIERIVIREPYLARYVTSAEQGLSILKSEHVDVVVSDMKMPVMDGLNFLKKAKDTHPDTVRIILSGFSQITQVLAAVNKGEIFRFLTKPLEDPEEFRMVIRAAVAHAQMERHNGDLRGAMKVFTGSLPPVAESILQISEVLRTRRNDESERLRLLGQLDQKCGELLTLLNTLKSVETSDDRK